MIYFDNAATTYPKPECVYAAVDNCQRHFGVNAGRGTYKTARQASEVIQKTRVALANLVNIRNENKVIFSPSATVAMNIVLNGLDYSPHTTVYITPFEHNAVARPLKRLSDIYGFSIEMLPFNGRTQELDKEAMRNKFIVKHPDIVILNHLSNVTGNKLPVDEIFNTSKEYGAINILDASQSLGLVPIDLSSQKVDFLIFAGHKNLYGSFGTGGFVYNSNVKLKPYLTGGTGSDSLNLNMPEQLPDFYEPASHDIISISALSASLSWITEQSIKKIYIHKKELTDYTVQRLSELSSVTLYLPENRENHIAIISLTHIDYRPEELADILDNDFDIAVRSGYHCAPYVHKLIGTENTGGTLRISIGYFNTKNDIDSLINALGELD
ncbi:MAG: aminotransferase class V-fold PLP-dependent enzyme [Ruminococcus sp.]|nr:aminotransferase class V-fold PLP-dependent enzyme [Ruminococcus sp.]